LYLQLLHTGNQWVICLDAETGKEIWKVNRPSDGKDECPHSYASPTICPKSDKNPEAYLITHGNDYAIGHSLNDGSELWRVTSLNPKEKYNNTLRFVASPVASGGLVVVPTAKNGQVVAIKPEAKGTFGPGSSNEVWRKPSNTPDVPSPLVLDGLVYLCREDGRLICLDAATGEEKYQERTTPGRFRASPVSVAGHILVTNRDKGTVTVVKAGPKFEKVAENTLPDILAASPAISGPRVYLRGVKTLWCVGEVTR
jgi:outer membrane protein assembly factor BamB